MASWALRALPGVLGAARLPAGSFLACVCTCTLQLRGSCPWLCLLCSLLLNSHPKTAPREGLRAAGAAQKGTWLMALTLQGAKPPANPELLPGFLSWKLFSHGNSHFQQFLQEPRPAAPPFAASPPSCSGFCVFLVEFSKQNPRGLLLLKPCWAGRGLGQLGAEPLVLVALQRPSLPH